ncbi:MAG: hypothetical protein LIR46_06815 [Bacteroidota bacterium]|nr:hypothetical protein [Bacteroidota bacterium]
MLLDLLFERNSHCIGFDQKEKVLYAWRKVMNYDTCESEIQQLGKYDIKTKKAWFSVKLSDDDIDKKFINEFERHLKLLGFNS